MSRRETLLRLAVLACFSLVFAIIIYATNFLLIPKIAWLRLSQRELLFVEGLLFLVLGVFFLASTESHKPSIGAKRWLLYGMPSMGTRGKITPTIISIALALIFTGVILILLSLQV